MPPCDATRIESKDEPGRNSLAARMIQHTSKKEIHYETSFISDLETTPLLRGMPHGIRQFHDAWTGL